MQVQILAKILQRASGYLYSSLPESDVRLGQLQPVKDISACVRDLRDRHTSHEALNPIALAELPRRPQPCPI